MCGSEPEGAITPPSGGMSWQTPATSTSPIAAPEPAPVPPPMSMWSALEKGEPSFVDALDVENSSISSASLAAGCPSYPPSEVRNWMVCPAFWHYSRTWEPRAAQWTPHALVGTAIHAGIAAYLRNPDTEGTGPASPLHVAIQTLGEGYVEQETWSLLSLSKLVEKGYCALRDAIQERWGVDLHQIYIEYADPHQDPRISRGRKYRVVDFVRCHQGCEPETFEVWDWKTKINLDDQYLGEALRSGMHSWQLLDYSWHVQQWTGTTVTQAGHGLVVLGPGKPKVHWPTVRITPERLTQWHAQARRIWSMMWHDEHMGLARMNFEACSDRHMHFGRECLFLPACHQLNGNQNLFSSLYKMRRNT